MIHHGITRSVVLAGPFALKFPSLRYGGRHFKLGTTCNLAERAAYRRVRDWGTDVRDRLCPALWCAPFGLMLVMRRAEPLGRDPRVDELAHLWDWSTDHKEENYGILKGRVVCIDYA